MTNKESRRLFGYANAQKKARTFGHPSLAGAKPDWSFAPKGLVKIESTGRMEMNKRRH
jgi:hypothetical protein